MKSKPVLLTVVLVLLAACSSRAKLTPDKAMLGQWDSLTTHYYIGPEKITHRDKASGDRVSYSYKIIVTNDVERTVTFQDVSAAMRVYETFKFADDNRSFNQIIEIAGTFDEPLKFTYVDGKQEP